KSRAFEVRRLQYNANTGAVTFQRDDPEPALQSTNHTSERAIDPLLAFQPFIVGEERKLLQMLITFLQLELIPDHGIAPARVDDIARANIFGGTCFCTSEDARKRVPP